ncbi:MAG: hypothetical protein ABH878_07600 [bacterium]
MKLCCLAIILFLLIVPAAFAQYAIGDTVADFTLIESNGDTISLSDYGDRIVFLVFWESG